MKRIPVAAVFAAVITLMFSAATLAGQKAVLVTGASTGIGLKITEKLSASGFYVYAGARKAADLERLDAMDNVSSVRLDVTEQGPALGRILVRPEQVAVRVRQPQGIWIRR